MNNEAWRDRAACAEHPKEWWYVEPGSEGMHANVAQARTICGTCPVARQCLDYAMENGERYGMWGGKSVRERRKLLKGWAITRPCSHCGTKMHITLGGNGGTANTRASLDGARLDDASLVGASLYRARLDDASLVGARLDDASLVGARYNRYTRWPAGFNPAAAGAVSA